jgi:primosomal protein N'
MKLVEVSVISAKVAKDSLTYFSAKDVRLGDVVVVEVRKSRYDALVIDVRDVKDLKQEIKNATFGFKKIVETKGTSKFYSEFFEACHTAKQFFVGNLGQIVAFFIPAEFLKIYEELPLPKARVVGSSVFHIAPTVRAVERLAKELGKEVFILHGKLSKKKLLARYTEILESPSSVTVVMTPSGVFLPRHDVGKIIVHDEHSSAYRTIKRPYIDLRLFLKSFREEMRREIEFLGQPLTLETIIENNLPISNVGGSTSNIVDMSDKENRHGKSFIFSKDVFEEIKTSDKVFAFALRKGLGSSVVCHDCGHVVKDGDTALILRQRGGERILLNPQTGATLDPKTRCGNCGSWNFDTLGIGTDTVAEEAKKLFPKKKIFQIDSDVTKTDKKVREVVEKFYKTGNAILVGTELAIPHLEEKVDASVVISMDALLSIPSYKIYEKMLHLGHAVKNTAKALLIQTRDIENIAIQTLASGNLKKFYEHEKVMREKFGYPPFGTIIRISRTSNKDDFDRVAAPLIAALSAWSPAARRIKRGKVFETIIILKLPKKIWNTESQDQNLSSILSSLTPDWQVRVNPESLF